MKPMNPQRIQLSRKEGFNLQEASQKLNGLPAVVCTRAGKYGNPYKIGETVFRHGREVVIDRALAIELFWPYATNHSAKAKSELRGKNLACFCPLTEACHCDVWLAICNFDPNPPMHRCTDAANRNS